MSIIGSLRAKGVSGYAARAGMIAARFGPTPARIDHALRRYLEVMQAHGAQPTLPITAAVLSRHPALIRGYAEAGVEFAVHGMVHGDHRGLTYAEQLHSLLQAEAVFRRAGIPYSGFRGPYLRYNHDTDRALLHLRYRYHSSQAVAFPVLQDLDGKTVSYRRALTYYMAEDARTVAVRPRDSDGLIHLPVAVPDDEIMVDRLHLNDRAQLSAWLAILDWTYRRGELFTLQLHPERIFHCGLALSAVLEEARRRSPRVWLASLGEIATWWSHRRAVRLEATRVGAEVYRVDMRGDQGAKLIGRNLAGVPSREWFGPDRLITPSVFELRSTRKPVVGLSLSTPLPVREFLHEEGFPTEITDDPATVGCHLHVDGRGWQEQAVLEAIDQAPGPLVRLARWPNGARSAMAVTGDIDAITLQDFAMRIYETSKSRRLRQQRHGSTGERRAALP